MKKTNLTISFESEKLDALLYYMEKKDVDLQSELAETIQKLCVKHIPAPTLSYIEDKLNRENTAKVVPEKKKNVKEIAPNETD